MLAHPRLSFSCLAISRLMLIPPRLYVLFTLPYNSEFRYWWETMRYFSAQGAYPYLHYWSEYPPFYPWLVVGLDRLSQAMFSGQAAQICFYLLMALVLVAAEMGSLILLYQLARLMQDAAARQAVLLFAYLFPPLYLWAGWWDTIPVFLLMLALFFYLRSRWPLSALIAGVGMLVKLFPAFMLPVAIGALPTWRRKVGYGLVAMLTVTVLLAPLGAVNPTMMWASFQNIVSRPSWETVWALFDGYYAYGIVAGFADRLDPAQALTANHSSRLPWSWIMLAFGLIFLIFYLGYGRWQKDAPELPASRVVAALAASLTLLLLCSKGYSPQYLMWVAPFVVMVLPNRTGAAVLGTLLLANLIELPVYMMFFPDQRWLLWLTVLTRTALLIWLAWTFLKVSVAVRPFHLLKAQPQRMD